MTSPPLHVSDWLPAPIQLPGKQHEFAVGDVHGVTPAFVTLLDAMGAASAGRGWLTLLGDLCDRGPDTLGAYRAAFGRMPREMGFQGRTGLLGNHEMMLLGSMVEDYRSRGSVELWMPNGGRAVLAEMGLTQAEVYGRPERLRRALTEALGAPVLGAIEKMKSHRMVGNLVFVHAGVDPRVPLKTWFQAPRLFAQSEDHWAWIRWPFFSHEVAFHDGRVVVHGHTHEHSIQSWKGRGLVPDALHRLDGWRLGLDGGSYSTGKVAGAEFRDGAYRVYVAGHSA